MKKKNPKPSQIKNQYLKMFDGEGEILETLRNKDWSKSELGTPDTWTQSLSIALGTACLRKSHMPFTGGPDLNLIYNEGFKQIPGDKHPVAPGAKGIRIVVRGMGYSWACHAGRV